MNAKVIDLKRETRHGLFSSADDVEGWSVTIECADGTTMGLSQLDGEYGWTADSVFGPNGYPHWCNGFGARYLRTKQLIDVEAVQAVEAAVESAKAIW